jgi:hypothetical protein
MNIRRSIMLVSAGLLVLAMSAFAENKNESSRLGVGAHYWLAVKNIDVDNVDEHGLSWTASYQYWPTLVGGEVALEWFQSGYAGADKDVFEPEAFLLVGDWIYAAAGIGAYRTDNDWGDKPFYMLRAGLNLNVLPHIYLDVNGTYRFEDWSGLSASDIDSDTITLGAAARLAF